MRTPPSCPDVLFARACRHALSGHEEEQFAAHLRQCASCRVAKLVADDFDCVPSVLPGDDQLIARVAGRLVGRPPIARPRGRLVVLVAAALLTLGTVAAALSAPRARSHREAASANVPQQPASPGSVAIPTKPTPSLAEDPTESASLESGSHEGGAAAAAGHRADDAPRDRDGRAHARSTAASLFAEANGLRGAGQISEALTKYGLLQALFPHSVEAVLSHVSTGNLLMARNEAEPALEQFKSYLSESPHGVLREEALFGEARALRASGRFAEESETWNTLLSAYPDSVYGQAGRARIQELR